MQLPIIPLMQSPFKDLVIKMKSLYVHIVPTPCSFLFSEQNPTSEQNLRLIFLCTIKTIFLTMAITNHFWSS